MTKSELFKAAHKIARETKDVAGSYRIAFACALKDLYAGVVSVEEEKTPAEKAWEHFSQGKVYTYRNGDEAVFVAPYALRLDPPRRIRQARISVIITRHADGSFDASYNDNYRSGESAVWGAIREMFA